MKKQLLIGTALFAAVSAFSQNGYMKPRPSGIVDMAEKLARKYSQGNNTNETTGTANKANPVGGSNTEVTAVTYEQNGVTSVATPTVQWKAIGGTMNIFGMLVSQSKPLQYTDDLNLVSMVHRKGTTYTANPTSNSGAIVAHLSSNWGSTWDSTCIWSDGTNLARYPQGGIYNPAGGQNINNAYVVGTGPVTGGSGWLGNWYASKQLGAGNYNNTASSVPGAQQFIANTPPFAAGLGKHDMSRYGFTSTDDGKVRSLGMIVNDENGGTNAAFGLRGTMLVKGTFNAGVFNWTGDSLIPNTVLRTDGSKQLWSTPNMAWNEAGDVGYVMMIGALATATAGPPENLGWQPIIWKTTNSGTSWSQVNGIDFSAPTFSPILDHIPSLNTNTAVTAPFVALGEGWDMVVDDAGKLHIVCLLQGTYSQDPDSLAYTYQFGTEKYSWAHVPGNRPYLYEFIGNGSSAWTYRTIDSLSTEGPGSGTSDPGYADNPWDADPSNSNSKVTSDSRIQASRTPAGDVIMYSWAESDTNFTTSQKKWNSLPNLHARAVTATSVSPQEPIFTKPSPAVAPIYTVNSNIASRAMFHYQSRTMWPVSCNSGTLVLRCPFTISNSGPPNYTQLSENRLWYSSASLEFTGLTCPSNVGFNQALAYNVNNIDVYPNPAHGNATVILNLKEETAASVNIYNMIGQIVKSANIAATAGENKVDFSLDGLPAGVYMVKVKAGNTTSTKKIILQ